MQNIPAPASARSPPRQATPATPAAPFRIIPGSAYWGAAPGVQGAREVAVPLVVAVPYENALVAGQDAAASTASADRFPVCRCVRYAVQARCTYRIPPAARAGVSSACTASACPSRSFTRSRNPLDSTRAAAFARTPAIQPADTFTPARSAIKAAARPDGTKFPQVRFAACAWVSGPNAARARTPSGSVPSVTSPQHGQAFDCATCSVTSGSGAGKMSVTWWRRCAQTGSPSSPVPQPAHSAGGYQNRCFGLSTSFIVDPGSPGCFPGDRLPFSRSDRSRGGFFRNGLSEEGGFDDVPESFATCRSSRSTRALSSLISRYASASLAASSSCGRAASSSAVGSAGSAGTIPPCHLPQPDAASEKKPRPACDYPVTSNNSLTPPE